MKNKITFVSKVGNKKYGTCDAGCVADLTKFSKECPVVSGFKDMPGFDVSAGFVRAGEKKVTLTMPAAALIADLPQKTIEVIGFICANCKNHKR